VRRTKGTAQGRGKVEEEKGEGGRCSERRKVRQKSGNGRRKAREQDGKVYQYSEAGQADDRGMEIEGNEGR
jgi:hypothetical protein